MDSKRFQSKDIRFVYEIAGKENRKGNILDKMESIVSVSVKSIYRLSLFIHFAMLHFAKFPF